LFETQPAAVSEPSPIDPDEIRQSLSAFFGPGETFQVVALPAARHFTGTVEDPDGLVRAIKDLPNGQGLYHSLNPVASGADRRARDADIVRRRWLLIDVDPVRQEPNSSASDEEKERSTALASRVAGWLASLGWPAPAVVDSGNGRHLRYRIDLPNDDPSRSLVRRVLKALAARFDSEDGRVDTSVSDAARLARLPGTWARKGEDAPGRPHRMARVVSLPTTSRLSRKTCWSRSPGPPIRAALPVPISPTTTASSSPRPGPTRPGARPRPRRPASTAASPWRSRARGTIP
jgi:hypothetical protein